MITERSIGWLAVLVLVGACGRTEGGARDSQNRNLDGSDGVAATTTGGSVLAQGGHATSTTTGPTLGSAGRPTSGGGGGASAANPGTPEAGAAFVSMGGTADGAGGAGQGGESTAPSGGCHFEYLGDWIRCEGDNDYPWSRDVVNQSLADCTKACLAQPDCVAVVDYYWMNRPDLGCTLDVSSCSRPGPNEWAEEDHGKEFRKVCN